MCGEAVQKMKQACVCPRVSKREREGQGGESEGDMGRERGGGRKKRESVRCLEDREA